MTPGEFGHFFLDILGLAPVIGEPADAINATWYAAEGDHLNAAISGASTIPGAGAGIGLGKITTTLAKITGKATKTGPEFFRGAKAGQAPSFQPRPNEFKVDPQTGFVRDTHGVSVFDNPQSVSSKGFVPHRVDQGSVPDSLRVIQRGQDPHHYEIVPRPGANLTPEQFARCCLSQIQCG